MSCEYQSLEAVFPHYVHYEFHILIHYIIQPDFQMFSLQKALLYS